MGSNDSPRRLFLSASAALGASAILAACKQKSQLVPEPSPVSSPAMPATATPEGSQDDDDKKKASEDVAAAEDLMREHGVLRRALIVYRESATRLRGSPTSVPLDSLQRTAKLFRSFGEDYHERKLEEAYIFPAVKKAASAAPPKPIATNPLPYVNVLLAQHARGREITDYILAVTQSAKLGASAAAFAGVLEAFVRMYQSHTAIEDTIIFPAWKDTMTVAQYDELGDKFEEIEHTTFGKDGFDDAVNQIAAIEAELGLTDLSKMTAPPPPVVPVPR